MDVLTLLRAMSMLCLLALAAPSHAKPFRMPGNVQIGVAPIGFQVLQSRGSTVPTYRAAFDLAYKYGRVAKGYQLWFGVGAGWAPVERVAGSLVQQARVDLFAHLSVPRTLLEAPAIGLRGLRKLPLVPYVRAGVSGDLQYANQPISTAIGLRLGGGLSYFVSDRVGLDLNAGVMVGFGPNQAGTLGLTTGSFDVLAGLRFAAGKKKKPKKK